MTLGQLGVTFAAGYAIGSTVLIEGLSRACLGGSSPTLRLLQRSELALSSTDIENINADADADADAIVVDNTQVISSKDSKESSLALPIGITFIMLFAFVLFGRALRV
jgi:hypothetical protein